MLYVILLVILLLIGFKLRQDKRYFRYYIAILLTAIIVFFSIKYGKLIFALLAFLVPFLLKIFYFLIRNSSILKWFFLKNKQNPVRYKAKMTKAEAYKILDLQDGSSKLEIKNQYKKLIKNNHPDKGGSKHISALLNEAKAILLKN